MTNRETMKKLVKQYGMDAIVELAKQMEDEIRIEEAKYTTLINPYEYSDAGRSTNKNKNIEYPAWVEETFNNIIKEMNIAVSKKGSGDSHNMAITHKNFAKYIVYTCNDDGETLKNVIKVLRSAPAWCRGYGLTRPRMELVFHILVLHRNYTNEIITELSKFLNKYDPTALKVFANADDAFRHTLNHEIQMIAFTERHICDVIMEETKFEYERVA